MSTVASKHRINRAFIFATIFEVFSIGYTLEFFALLRENIFENLRKELKNREMRALRFFAALNRSGEFGYAGTKCTLQQLSDHMSKILSESMSLSTLKRALKGLEEKGYITRTPYVPEMKKNSGYEVRPGVWRTKTLVIVALTEKATCLWNGQQKRVKIANLPSSNNSIEGSKRATEAPLNYFPPSKGEKINNHVSSNKQTTSDHVESKETAIAVVSTRSNSKSQVTDTKASNEACDVPQNALKHQTSTKTETPQRKGIKPKIKRGVTVELPANVPTKKPRTWRWNRLRLLLELSKYLAKHPSRAANAVFQRAREETTQKYDRQMGTSANWDYFVLRWPEFAKAQRKQFLKEEIIPGLQVLRTPNTKNHNLEKFIESKILVEKEREKRVFEIDKKNPYLKFIPQKYQGQLSGTGEQVSSKLE